VSGACHRGGGCEDDIDVNVSLEDDLSGGHNLPGRAGAERCTDGRRLLPCSGLLRALDFGWH
jgi:hypothetical protein